MAAMRDRAAVGGTAAGATGNPASPAGLPVGRERVAFPSGGATCAGYLYLPADAAPPFPAVILAHGFSGTMDRLLAHAARFAAGEPDDGERGERGETLRTGNPALSRLSASQ
jgi:hypothetical protein